MKTITEKFSEEIATTAICISEAIMEAEVAFEEGKEDALGKRVSYVRGEIGSWELRQNMVNLANSIELAASELNEPEDVDLYEDIMERIGCWDFEFIPALVRKVTSDLNKILFCATKDDVKAIMTEMIYGDQPKPEEKDVDEVFVPYDVVDADDNIIESRLTLTAAEIALTRCCNEGVDAYLTESPEVTS
jgi:hypothetical protein